MTDRKEYYRKYNKNRKNRKEYFKEYFKLHPRIEYQREYRKTEAYKKSIKKYRSTERAKIIQKGNVNRFKKTDKWREHQRNRYINDIQYKLSKILRLRIYSLIKSSQKSGSMVRDIGCSLPELKIWLESQFKDGMTWNNLSVRGWHIDHKKPLNSFDLTKREQFLQAVHYTNLQPLWAIDNLKKGCKV